MRRINVPVACELVAAHHHFSTRNLDLRTVPRATAAMLEPRTSPSSTSNASLAFGAKSARCWAPQCGLFWEHPPSSWALLKEAFPNHKLWKVEGRVAHTPSWACDVARVLQHSRSQKELLKSQQNKSHSYSDFQPCSGVQESFTAFCKPFPAPSPDESSKTF